MDIEAIAVTAAEMSAIESRIFAAGMPVAALMEKAGILLANRMQQLYPPSRVGALVGTGHNGADALVVARELHLRGYSVCFHQPIDRAKELTLAHARYAASLGIRPVEQADLLDCDWIIDGLFGFGLTRAIEGELADLIEAVNQSGKAIVSIDLPSGLHTDTGEVMGTAIRATHSLCLGLWKRAYLHDRALPYTGLAERLDFGISIADLQAVLGASPPLQRITPAIALAPLILPRSPLSHKYRQGHLLLVCGSQQYGGAAILAGLAASASGVGMLSIAVPLSLKPLLTTRLPEALIVGCEETPAGAIAHLPLDLSKYDAIACGCGLTPDAIEPVQQVVQSDRPLVLDADGLNIIAERMDLLSDRTAPTLLTPHPGEFKRLFPAIDPADRLLSVQQAAQQCGATVLLKGAKVAIAQRSGNRIAQRSGNRIAQRSGNRIAQRSGNRIAQRSGNRIAHQDRIWVNPDSTPALARGGSGDVLTGLAGGLLAEAIAAKHPDPIAQIAISATWWHAQAAIATAQERGDRGVDPVTLSQALVPTLHRWQQSSPRD